MREVVLSVSQQAVELAKAAGADGVWATASQSRDVSYELRDGELETVKDAVAQSLGLRLYVDGRYAYHATTDLREASLRSFLSEAVALTRALEPDADRALPDPALFEGQADVDLQLVDPGVHALTGEHRLAAAKAQNALLAGKDKVVSATSSVYDGYGASAHASSNGFSGARESTYYWLESSATVQGDGDKRPSGDMGGGGVRIADAPTPEAVAALALERAYERIGSVSGPTARLPLLVDAPAVARLLGYLLRPANGSSVHQKQSFFQGKLGTKIASTALTLVDDPLRPGWGASRRFDGEGIAARALPLFEAGVLKNLYVDTTYGRKIGLAPTTGDPSNRVVLPGTHSTAELIAGVQRGVFLTGWLGGNSNPTTGDFSFGLQGRMIQDGALGASINEMNVTGNLLELFSRLAEVASTPWPYGSTRSPALLFDDVQFSGSGG